MGLRHRRLIHGLWIRSRQVVPIWAESAWVVARTIPDWDSREVDHCLEIDIISLLREVEHCREIDKVALAQYLDWGTSPPGTQVDNLSSALSLLLLTLWLLSTPLHPYELTQSTLQSTHLILHKLQPAIISSEPTR